MQQFDQSILLPELFWLFNIFILFYLFLVILNKKKILKSFYFNKMMLKNLIFFTQNITKYVEYCSKQYIIRFEKHITWKISLNLLIDNFSILCNNFKIIALQLPLNFELKKIIVRKNLIKKIKFIL